jgi:hypothetical protein
MFLLRWFDATSLAIEINILAKENGLRGYLQQDQSEHYLD